MTEKTIISINTYIKYPDQEIYKKLKILAVENNIPLGELIGKIIEYVIEDQNRLQEVLKRIKQNNN